MTLRPVEIDERPLAQPQKSIAPRLKWIDIDLVDVDDAYQRPLKPANWLSIRRIAEKFNWAHFTPVMVSTRPDGRFSLIDGQHRTHAARLAGFDAVPGAVHDMDVAQQAAAFSVINGQVTAISQFHIFKAALAAGERWAQQADKAVADAGCRLMTGAYTAAQKKPGMIFVIALIRQHVDAGRGRLVTRGLDALWSAASVSDLLIWQNGFLRPWFLALQVPGALDTDLGAFLQAHDPVKLIQRVDRLRATPKYAGTSKVSLVHTLLVRLMEDWVKRHG